MFSKQGTYLATNIFSLEHVVASLICFAIVIICVYLINDMCWQKFKPFYKIIGSIVPILLLFELVVDACVGNNNIENFVPIGTTLIFSLTFASSFCGNEKIKRVANAVSAYFGVAFGTAFLVFTVPNFSNYPIFHVKCLFSLFSSSIMLFCGIVLIQKKQVKINLKSLKFALVAVIDLLVDCIILNTMFNTNFMFISSPKGLNIAWLNSLYLFSNGFYSLFAVSFYVASILLVYMTYKLYNALKKFYEKTGG